MAVRGASLPSPLDVLDDSLLEGLDEAAVRSLNGARARADRVARVSPDHSFSFWGPGGF